MLPNRTPNLTGCGKTSGLYQGTASAVPEVAHSRLPLLGAVFARLNFSEACYDCGLFLCPCDSVVNQCFGDLPVTIKGHAPSDCHSRAALDGCGVCSVCPAAIRESGRAGGRGNGLHSARPPDPGKPHTGDTTHCGIFSR